MLDEKNNGSATAGSPIEEYLGEGANVDPNKDDGLGQSTDKESSKDFVPRDQHKALEQKLSSQSEEMKELKERSETLDVVSPLLEILNDDPELAKAITDRKINSKNIAEIIAGGTKEQKTEIISEAQKEVKKELGSKEYSKLSNNEIETLIESKVSEGVLKATEEFSAKFSDLEEVKRYENKLSDFVSNTPDFVMYAPAIDKFMDETGIRDIKIAYDTIKGRALQEKYKNEEAINAAEIAKGIASNVGGGSSQVTANIKKEDEMKNYLGNMTNPNSY